MSLLVTDNPVKALQAYAPTVTEDIRKSHPAYIVQIFPLEDFPELQTFIRDQYIIDQGDRTFCATLQYLSLPETIICLRDPKTRGDEVKPGLLVEILYK